MSRTALIAQLDAQLAAAEVRFNNIYTEVTGDLDTYKIIPGAPTGDNNMLAKLHLPRTLRRDIEDAIRDEHIDAVEDFFREQEKTKKMAKPPPPPFPPPPFLLKQQPPPDGNVNATPVAKETNILSRMTAEAKASILGKNKEIQRLQQELEQRDGVIADYLHWRETATQYGSILLASIQGLLLDTARTEPPKPAEREALTRLCLAFAAHIGREGGANVLPEQVRTEMRRRSTALAASFHPASVGGRVRNSIFGDADAVRECRDGSPEGSGSASGSGCPLPFLYLSEKEEDATEILFSLYLLVQHECARSLEQPHSSARHAASPKFVGRRCFLLVSFMLDLFDARATLSLVEGAFEQAALGSPRGQAKFSSRLELNDFVAAMDIIADAKYSASSALTLTLTPLDAPPPTKNFPICTEPNPRLRRLLSSLAEATQAFLHDHVLRRRWIESFGPVVATCVYSKLSRYQDVIYSAYIRSKNYGLVDPREPRAATLGDISLYAEGDSSKHGHRQKQGRLMQAVGVPVDAALPASRSLLAFPIRKSPTKSSPPSSPSSPTSLSSPSSVSTFETFCVNFYVVPLLSRATTARRIAQYIQRLDRSDGFRAFAACLAYLAIVSSARSFPGATSAQPVDAAQRHGFEEAVDKIIALVDAGTLAASGR